MTASTLLADPDYPGLKGHLIESTGLAYYADKDEDLARHISERLHALGLEACGAYLEILRDERKGEPELQIR